MQCPHQEKTANRQEEDDAVVPEGAALVCEVKVRINPPRLLPCQVEEKRAGPHPEHVKGHERERLENFHCVDIETIVDGYFGEHEAHWNNVDGNVQKHSNWTHH